MPENPAVASHPGPWGIVSDAHGNPFGLAACLEALKDAGAETIFFLGDAVGYLPLEGDVIDRLAVEAAVCVSGNHEAMLLGSLPTGRGELLYRIELARARLSPMHQATLAAWPDTRWARGTKPGAPDILLLHGGPDDPWRQYIYPDSDLSFAASIGAAAMICGHTHHAFVRRQDGVLIVNAGSCGLPRDVRGQASCVLFDPESLACEIVRRSFDTSALLAACEAVAAPHPDVVRALGGMTKRRQ